MGHYHSDRVYVAELCAQLLPVVRRYARAGIRKPRDLAPRLNAEGFKTASGARWTPRLTHFLLELMLSDTKPHPRRAAPHLRPALASVPTESVKAELDDASLTKEGHDSTSFGVRARYTEASVNGLPHRRHFHRLLTRLNGHEQKAAKITAIDLQMDPSAPGLQFHKIDKSKDTNFWSLRVNRDLRIVVHRTPGSILLCYVAHHDKAYTWAERRRIEAHPRTGTIQIVEIRERVEEVSPEFNYPAGAKRNGRASASAFRRTVARCSARRRRTGRLDRNHPQRVRGRVPRHRQPPPAGGGRGAP